MTGRFSFVTTGLATALLLNALLVTPSWAELGGRTATISSDQRVLRARLSAEARSNFTVHSLTSENGLVTREYVNGQGVVFAIAWEGPSRPDLKAVLGGYFDRFQSDTARRPGQARRMGAMRSSHVDFIAVSGGHGGEFWGHAYLPSLVPAGFDLKQLD